MMYAAGVCGIQALSACLAEQRLKKELKEAKEAAIKAINNAKIEKEYEIN